MTDTNTDICTVELDTPIIRGEQTIAALQIRKPKSGELRGLSLVEIGQLQVTALTKLLPRITIPVLTEHEVAGLDPADLLAVGAMVGRFLLQKSERTDALGQ